MSDVTLNGEIADSICKASLKFHLEVLNEENRRLINMADKPAWVVEEVLYNLSMKQHFKAILEYYGESP